MISNQKDETEKDEPIIDNHKAKDGKKAQTHSCQPQSLSKNGNKINVNNVKIKTDIHLFLEFQLSTGEYFK